MPRAASASASDEGSAPSGRSGPTVTPSSEKPRCRFTTAQRLRQKREFDAVYRQARRSTDDYFTVLVRPNAHGQARLGLSIGGRAVGNAVRRNLVKRLIRESFRLHQHGLPPADIVVNARSAVRAADNRAILRSLERHWQAVIHACARS